MPPWLSEKKRKTILKKDTELRRRVELIQDFEMPVSVGTVEVSPDGRFVLASGKVSFQLHWLAVAAVLLDFFLDNRHPFTLTIANEMSQ